MKKIRKNMFETNSSSVHTITISKDGLEKSNLRLYKRKNEDGTYGKYIIGKLGSFDKDCRDYTTQEEKLSYLLTLCYFLDGHYDLEDTIESWAFKELERQVCEYCKCDGIKINEKTEKDAHIDHQTLNDYSYLEDFKMNYIDFIFNKYVNLHTDSD